jgi:hypothetical protein
MRRTRVVGLAACALILVACSSGSDAGGSTSVDATSNEDAPNSADENVDSRGIIAGVEDSATIEDVLAATSEPEEVNAAADRSCEKYGFVCSALDSTPAQLDTALALMGQVSQAIEGSDDAREQLRLALVEVAGIAGVGYLEADLETATMLSFSVDGGPLVSVLTEAGLLREDGEVAPIDTTTEVGPEPQGLVRPQGIRGPGTPERYEPAGGPTNDQRTALIVNPLEWSGADEIAGIFRAEEEYTTVDVLTGADVNPFTMNDVGGYDAVHITSHGGGSCPPWTDDRDSCSSTLVGGEIDLDVMAAGLADSEVSVGLDFWLCSSEGANRYCFNSNAFAPNPNGIAYFGSCGSDFGFNNAGAGASVGWTGTTQRRVAERTGVEFWRLMVTEGVEFRLAEQLIKQGGYDSHTSTWWASGGDVNMFTESAFSGRNLRARDVVEPRIDGEKPFGQVVNFNGTPEDGQPEAFPAKGQEVTFVLDGVREGSESAVQFEVRGEGKVWEIDVELPRDGSVLQAGNGYASWIVTLKPDSVKIPDVKWSDLLPSATPIDLEVRAFETKSEYTADLGSIRLGTTVIASGPIPIFTELETVIASAGGEVTGNDLRVEFETQGGPATGELHVAMIGQGIEVGTWDIALDGTYDPESGEMVGTFDAQSQASVAFISAGDLGSGEFAGRVDLSAKTVTLMLGVGGQAQQYNGTFVS